MPRSHQGRRVLCDSNAPFPAQALVGPTAVSAADVLPSSPEDLGAIIHRVQSRFIRAAEAHDVFDALLPELLALTASEYGFVGEVWYDDAGAPYLKIFTLTDIAWDDATREFIERERIHGIEFRNLDSLLGAAMTSRRPVISNAPRTDARSGGLPMGHPGMRAYLGVPLFHGGAMVGQVGLANRPGGYDDALVERLEPLFAAVGAIIGAVQLERQRRRAEAALRASEERYHTTFELAHVGIAHVGPDGRMREVNPRLCEILGRPREELQQLSFGRITHPADLDANLSGMQDMLAGRRDHYVAEQRYLRPNGNVVWARIASTLLRTQSGEPDHFVTVIEDITERKRADAVLRDRDTVLHKLTQQVPGVIHQLKRTPEGRLTMPYVSAGVRAAFELEPEDVRDDARKMFARIHPDDAKPMWASTLRSFETLEPWRATYRVQLPKGGLRWHEAHSVAERLADGSVLWTGYIVDITERKHYEEVSVAAEAAQRTSIAKTEFLSRMSHELRTPLNAVLGFAQLLLGEGAEPLSDAQRAKLKHIETAGGHLLAMINDVLDLSRVESGSMLLTPDVVQVDAVAGEALARVAGLAQQCGVWLRADPPRRQPGTPALYVHADAAQLRQVLVNLLSNALKYNRSGGTAVIDWRAGPDGRSVLIGVSDTGPGLTEQQRTHLFEPFNRLGAERGKVQGTGIGLVITRRLVELMHGQISVQSELGRGSRFELQLPAAEPAGAPAEAPAAAMLRRSVLYAEDNPLNVELVREVLLLRPQYRLLVARSGTEALDVAAREVPDLLLIDMHLGDMSGLELARALDRNPALRGHPRVVLSADAVPERKQQASEAGFCAYLTKPVNVVALLGCLDEYLASSAA
jgi:PAS domain S-box-containing protein